MLSFYLPIHSNKNNAPPEYRYFCVLHITTMGDPGQVYLEENRA